MKTISNDLYLLIRSLNKNEKGYFQKFCKAFTGAGSSEYLELFEALDGLKAYDEPAFLKQNSKKNFTRHFSVRKNYLQGVIYKSLQHYYSSITIDTQIRNLLNMVEILCYKGLFKQSLQLLSRAEKLSKKYNRECFLLEIIDLKLSLTVMQVNVASLKKITTTIKTDTDDYIAHYHDKKKIQLISLRIIEDFQLHGDFLGLDAKRNKSLERELRKIASQNKSKFLRIHVLQTLSLLYLNSRDQRKRLQIRKEQYKLYKGDKSLVHDNLNRYVGCLWSLCQLYQAAGDYGKMNEHILQLKNTLANYQAGGTNYFQAIFLAGVYYLEIDVAQRTGNYKEGLRLVPLVARLLEKYDSIIREELRMIFKLYFALIYFMAEQYEDAQVWVQRILNDHVKVRKDIIFACRLLNLVIHYELKNYQYLENLVLYTVKKVREEGKKNAFIAGFINKLGKQLNLLVRNPDNSAEIWKDMRGQLTMIEKNPKKRIILEMVDFSKWVDSKILKKPLHEIYNNGLQVKR